MIDGWFNGWHQTAEIVATLNNQTNRLIAVQMKDPNTASQQMKWYSGYQVAEQLQRFGKKKKAAGMTPQQAEKVLKAMHGQ